MRLSTKERLRTSSRSLLGGDSSWRENNLPPCDKGQERRVVLEEVRHHLYTGIARVIQAGEPEGRVECLGERVVVVEFRALHPTASVVRLDDEHNLVRGERAVVVLVPEDD